jgi:hypothetical protein
LIDEAKRAYAAAALTCGDGLLAPAADAEVNAITKALSLPVPRELRQVYQVHGGQQYIAPGVTGLFGEHRLHSPAEVVVKHCMFMDTCVLGPLAAFPPQQDDWGYWVPQLLPFASWDAYDLCIDAASGEVWEFIPNTGLIRHRASVSAVLREVIVEVRAGREPQLGAMRSVT